jgi:hypothetical protein
MNIFIMILVFVFMAGYYLMDSPSQRVRDESIDAAVRITEVKSILTCMARAHTAAVALDSANPADAKEVLEVKPEECMEKYNVQSVKLCADDRRQVASCAPSRTGRNISNFIITTADMPQKKDTNLVLETLSKDFNAAPNFGMLITMQDDSLALLSGNGHRRSIPNSISNAAELADGQLIYITQYSVSMDANLGNEVISQAENIFCMSGERKVFRFGQWECMAENQPALCTGDTIWDSYTETCKIDPSRRPLCPSGQTAVELEDMWQCIDPTPIRECPNGMMAELDYVTLEWYCTTNESPVAPTKCAPATIAKRRATGGTLMRPGNLCNNCEKMILDEETCDVACVPDITKVQDPTCYPRASECRGTGQAFYFGFPSDEAYEAAARENLPELDGVEIPLDGMHSQNRRFNCLDCGTGGRIDDAVSLPPFVAVCE